jgi:TonB-linked SusC/RagA family outer membrane protein
MLRQRVMKLLIPIAFVLAIPVAAESQAGQVNGAVTSLETGQPLGAVQVYLEGTGRASITRADGSFTISDIPPGTYTLVAQSIGYQQLRQPDVAIAPGATVSLSLQLTTNVLALQEIVATGLIDPVEGVRSPITVGRVSRETMPVVAAGSAIENLQGRIAGVSINRGSGEPGEGTNLMLRTPTSVVMAGNPLIVVDGVILGSEQTTNIESLDIETMEVIKGAAAASLYGSRAGAGVISITTARGRALAAGQTQFTARTEMGFTEPIRSVEVPTHHHYLVDNPTNPTTYVDANGNPIERGDRVVNFFKPGVAFMDTPYPGPIYDNLETVFRPGNFASHSFSVAQNGESTNFALSLNRRIEQGALENNNGYDLNSFRLNLDHRFLNAFSLGVSAYHSRDDRDNVLAGFDDFLVAPPDVDLSAKDENGEFTRVLGGDFPFENPLWLEASRENDRKRARTLGGANLQWTPFTWAVVSGSVSYDRQDSETRAYTPKGTPTSVTSDAESDGSLSFTNVTNDTWNSDAQISLRRDFGPLNLRTTFRGLLELDETRSASAVGTDFFVGDVPDLDAAENQTSSSSESEIKSLGYLWDTALDYGGKYILTVLGRRDGSSLFGPDNRWHNYYRVAGAYRIAEEPWFNVPNIDEFKISFARGTAGGRPGFSAQYETWDVDEAGVSKANLGNRNLRPEHTTENEVSLELILFNRVSLELTQAWQETTDQLVLSSVPTITGFGGQWANGGTVSGNTTELTVQAQLLRSPTLSWQTTFVADRSRGKIEDWPFACQNPIWRYFCDGVGIYDIYGGRFIRSLDELATHHAGAALPQANEFQVNDEGYVVWVGEGNDYREGISKGLWGTQTVIGGRAYLWGIPFMDAGENGSNRRQKIGDGSFINLGWGNNLSYRGFNFHAQFHAAVGGDAINRSHQEMALENAYHGMDQFGKPEGLKKPIAYYTTSGLEGGTGNDAWMEDGSYLKLRTVSVNYRLNPQQLAGIGLGSLGVQSLSFGLIGRNIFTVTDYTGFDPEQALDFGSRTNQDRFSYPNTRNYTAEVQVTF